MVPNFVMKVDHEFRTSNGSSKFENPPLYASFWLSRDSSTWAETGATYLIDVIKEFVGFLALRILDNVWHFWMLR